MWISIVILVISTALLMLQFFKQTRLSWKVAMVLCPFLFAFSLLNIKNQNDIQNFTIQSLEKIAGRILWEDSQLTISFQNDINDIVPKEIGAQIKMFSLKKTTFPNDQKDFQFFFQRCKKDSVFDYSYLHPEYAKSLFNIFAEPNGSIYDKKEEESGVERFWFRGKASEATYIDPTLVSTELISGANVKSSFTSLSDLNGAIILAYLNIGFQNSSVFPTDLNWKLKTSAGYMLLHMPLQIDLTAKDNGVSIHRYVGICIPNRFFESAAEI